MSLDWDSVLAHALSLPGATLSTSYGKPAAKANGRAFISPGREQGSFCLHIDRDTVAMLIETDPGTYWQSVHYQGWPTVLVRYDSAGRERVLAMIDRAREQCVARPAPRPRSRRR